MVGLNNNTINIFSKSNELYEAYQKACFNLRVLTINHFKKYGITSYVAFESFVLSLCPYEDKVELLKFWTGNFPSEFIIDKITNISMLISSVDINLFKSFPEQLKCINYNSEKKFL